MVGNAAVTQYSDSESVASTSASEHKSSYASSSLGPLDTTKEGVFLCISSCN